MNRPRPPARDQQGAALIVVLVLLLIVTLLGLASLRGTLLEERMSANLYDRSLAFQAVESALRQAELKVSAINALAEFPTSGCNAKGFCAPPSKIVSGSVVWDSTSPAGVPRWENAGFGSWVNASKVTSGSIEITPQYFVEYMGMAPAWAGCDQLKPPNSQCLKPRFRITARTNDAGRARVMLQTSYAAP